MPCRGTDLLPSENFNAESSGRLKSPLEARKVEALIDVLREERRVSERVRNALADVRRMESRPAEEIQLPKSVAEVSAE